MTNSEERAQNHVIRGFTLIELLVVISIIAVLLAIILPSMRKIKEMARDTACKSNLKNIGLAVAMYLDDFDRKIPDTGSSNGFLWNDAAGKPLEPGSGGGAYWGTFYRSYLKETKVFGCPSLQRVPRGFDLHIRWLPRPCGGDSTRGVWSESSPPSQRSEHERHIPSFRIPLLQRSRRTQTGWWHRRLLSQR